MRWIAPTGTPDPFDENVDYVGRNIAAGIQGSRVPPRAISHTMKEIVGLIKAAGLTPSETDLVQLAKAVRSQALNFRTATGTANALTITLDPVPASWAELQNVPLLIKIAANNTGPATIKPNALSAVSIVRPDGTALKQGDLVSGSYVEGAYDGTSFRLTGFTLNQIQSIAADLQRSQVRADRGASSQSIANGIYTRFVSYGSSNVALLGGSTFSGGVLTIGASDAGLWFVAGNCRQFVGTNQGHAIQLLLNGTTALVSDGGPGNGSSLTHSSVARLVNLVAGDQIELQAVQTSGAAVTFNDVYSFSAVRLGVS